MQPKRYDWGKSNSLGNIVENHSAGLLPLDFENGGTIQLSGVAGILWDDEPIVDLPGAERLVDFRLDRPIETGDATSLRGEFVEYSPDNPMVLLKPGLLSFKHPCCAPGRAQHGSAGG